MNVPLISIGVSVIALLYALYIASDILKKSEGTAKMQEIAQAIREGAMAYLNRQSMTIGFLQSSYL